MSTENNETIENVVSEAAENTAEAVESTAEAVESAAESVNTAAENAEDATPSVGDILAGEVPENDDLYKEMKRKAKEEKKALKEKLKEEKRAAKEEKKEAKEKKGSKADNPDDINIVKDLISIFIYMLVVVVLCLLIITFVGQRTTVNGDSMNPTLENGDNLWIDKLKYKYSDPQRYDIVVFPQQDVFYIKRVVGLPGENVRIDELGNLYINGKILNDKYTVTKMTSAGDVGGEEGITLGPDEYFVLGDNRNNSHDSRDQSIVGNLTKKRITGKAVFRLTPFDKFGGLYKDKNEQ